MPVRSAKQHRRTRPRPHREGGARDSSGRRAAHEEEEEAEEARPERARKTAKGEEEMSHDDRVRKLRDALVHLRQALREVTAAAVSLARGEVRAFARRGRFARS